MFFRERNFRLCAVGRLRRKAAHLLSFIENFAVDATLPRHSDFYRHFSVRRVRVKTHVIDPAFRYAFQPYALPDTRRPRVKTAVGMPLRRLFAARDVRLRVVLDADFQLVFPIPFQGAARFQRKRPIAARMPAETHSVEIYFRPMAYRAESDENALLPLQFRGQGKFQAIDAFFHPVAEFQPRRLRFRAVRHFDFIRLPAREKVPFPVQTDGFFPLHQRIRIPLFRLHFSVLLYVFLRFAVGGQKIFPTVFPPARFFAFYYIGNGFSCQQNAPPARKKIFAPVFCLFALVSTLPAPFFVFVSFSETEGEKTEIFREKVFAYPGKSVDNGRKISYNNNTEFCRCRLAVWRQLPKLIPASSTLVTCSKDKRPFWGVLFLEETEY